MSSRVVLSACLVLRLLSIPSEAAAQKAKQSSKPDYSACGPQSEKHSVIKNSQQLLPTPAAGKAIIYFFWRGSSLRSWKGVQTKLAINGKFVAALSKNTYAFVEVSPGVQNLCAVGASRRASPNSLLALTVEAGKTYYFEGEPGGDLIGTRRTTLTQVSEEDGKRAVQKSESVTFTVKK